MKSKSLSSASNHDFDRRLTQSFDNLFARNTPHFGGGGPGYYDIHLEKMAPDGSELELILTFRSGERYCCFELECHLDLRSPRNWSALRKEMDALGLVNLPLPTIRVVRVVVVEGALVDQGHGPRKTAAFTYEKGPLGPVVED